MTCCIGIFIFFTDALISHDFLLVISGTFTWFLSAWLLVLDKSREMLAVFGAPYRCNKKFFRGVGAWFRPIY